MKHVMLDLETWGTSPGSDIRSIGAVVFDFENGPDWERTFYVNTDQGQSVGLTRDPATEEWWSKQTAEAQAVLEPNKLPIWVALHCFAGWFAETGAKTVWSHGALFDVGIIEAAYRACRFDIPWDYRASRDTRTVFEFFPAVDIPFVGVKHNALDDAIHQARWIVESVKQRRRQWPEYRTDIPDAWDAYMGDLVGHHEKHRWARLPGTFLWHEFWERLGAAVTGRKA